MKSVVANESPLRLAAALADDLRVAGGERRIDKLGRRRSIRWKLTAAFIAVAFFVAAFVGVVILIHFETVERAAQVEAQHVAELIADAVVEEHGLRAGLQEYVSRLNSVRQRDVVIVDVRKKGLADADPDEIGMIFNHDSGNEVDKTLSDGRIRTFVEKNEHHPYGARQMVVPLRAQASAPGSAAIGAVILEYTSIRDELFAAEREELYVIIGAGILVVVLVTFFGLGIARRASQPLRDLKDSVDRITAQDYGTRIKVTSGDEVGLLGAAFNRMAEDISASHHALLRHKSELEKRVAERTGELDQSNTLLQREVHQHRLAAERVEYLAHHDELTGLANRSLFLQRVAQHMHGAVSGRHKLALYLIDIERFKNINDSLGRPAGDALLRQVADWLTRSAGDATLLARVGEDHFAAVMPQVIHEDDIARLIEQSMDAFAAHAFRLEDAVFRIAAKIGIALFPGDGDSADTLFKNAEAALKKAKASGARYLFYAQNMTEAMAGKLSMENQLRQALDNEEFVLHYQPKVNLASGNLAGAEALIRWDDPRSGLVEAGAFIPLLEEMGLIHDVGRWVLRKAIEDHLRWHGAGMTAVRIAVNVSRQQLRHPAFIADIAQAIGVDARAPFGLELEIAESAIMEDVTHSIASLQAIRALGVSVAMDTFGSGLSSLGYLSRLAVGTLKIDRPFVSGMTLAPEGLALMSTFINLGHSLKLKVVATGVETEDQWRLLRLLSCDEMQGYLFCQPVPSAIFETRYLAISADAGESL